jgi:hypothetical protein
MTRKIVLILVALGAALSLVALALQPVPPDCPPEPYLYIHGCGPPPVYLPPENLSPGWLPHRCTPTLHSRCV